MEMDYNKIYNKILTDEEFMEIKQHGSSDYPFQYYYDNLELFDFHCIDRIEGVAMLIFMLAVFVMLHGVHIRMEKAIRC